MEALPCRKVDGGQQEAISAMDHWAMGTTPALRKRSSVAMVSATPLESIGEPVLEQLRANATVTTAASESMESVVVLRLASKGPADHTMVR